MSILPIINANGNVIQSLRAESTKREQGSILPRYTVVCLACFTIGRHRSFLPLHLLKLKMKHVREQPLSTSRTEHKAQEDSGSKEQHLPFQIHPDLQGCCESQCLTWRVLELVLGTR